MDGPVHAGGDREPPARPLIRGIRLTCERNLRSSSARVGRAFFYVGVFLMQYPAVVLNILAKPSETMQLAIKKM